jgi:hypothetical protein
MEEKKKKKTVWRRPLQKPLRQPAELAELATILDKLQIVLETLRQFVTRKGEMRIDLEDDILDCWNELAGEGHEKMWQQIYKIGSSSRQRLRVFRKVTEGVERKRIGPEIGKSERAVKKQIRKIILTTGIEDMKLLTVKLWQLDRESTDKAITMMRDLVSRALIKYFGYSPVKDFPGDQHIFAVRPSSKRVLLQAIRPKY